MKRGILSSFAASLLLSCIGIIPAFGQFSSVRVQVIDRGQADGILIRTPNQKWVVIDAGVDKIQAQSMKDVWGVDEVDLAIVSHRHIDHYGGMDDVLNTFTVRRFLMNMADCPNRSHDDKIRGIVSAKSIPSVTGNTVEIDGVKFTVLPQDPVDDDCPEDENDNSIVVRMDFGDFSMLFTGDSETSQRKFFMANHAGLLDVDVLKASHHGSRNGADGEVGGQDWMDFVDPAAVVISVKRDSQHDHPHAEAIQAYEDAVGHNRVYCTSRHGTVRVYGFKNGRRRIQRQFRDNGSCTFGSD